MPQSLPEHPKLAWVGHVHESLYRHGNVAYMDDKMSLFVPRCKTSSVAGLVVAPLVATPRARLGPARHARGAVDSLMVVIYSGGLQLAAALVVRESGSGPVQGFFGDSRC